MRQIRMGVTGLADEDRAHWTGAAKSERLLELLEIQERLDSEILRLTGEWDHDRAWEIDGALSARAWLANRAPVTNRRTSQLVKHARLVQQHDEIAAALADADVTTARIETIARVTSLRWRMAR